MLKYKSVKVAELFEGRPLLSKNQRSKRETVGLREPAQREPLDRALLVGKLGRDLLVLKFPGGTTYLYRYEPSSGVTEAPRFCCCADLVFHFSDIFLLFPSTTSDNICRLVYKVVVCCCLPFFGLVVRISNFFAKSATVRVIQVLSL